MADHDNTPPQHPGTFIRSHVLPKGMSVKSAAEHLEVGRPTLSNLLNGNSGLSPEMAARLEKAFGANREELLRLQTKWDEFQAAGLAKNLAVRRHVPTYLKITAHQLEGWADRIDARSELAVLLRNLIHKLVNTTASAISEIDFPGYDNSQRHGWDGWLVCDETTPWIPSGISGWEFGCNKDPAGKAKKDYRARTGALPPQERQNITFVFVTPRNWPGKRKWAEQKNAEKKWKAVRAYDASDLEQWMEQSIPVQTWLAESLGRPTQGLQSIEDCWNRWAGVTKPMLIRELFTLACEQYAKTVADWLRGNPTAPLTIAADSKPEALAFLASLFGGAHTELKSKGDRLVVFPSNSIDALRSLATPTSGIIPVICNDELEREIGGLHIQLHAILVRPKNMTSGDPDISLDILPDSAFEDALTKMGFERERIEALGRESGNSLTVLRRRLATIDAIKTPPWAKDGQAARGLIPMAFVGAWSAKSDADREVLGLLADTHNYDEIERRLTSLLQIEESPVWAIGNYRGLISKIDALYAVAASITQKDLENFFFAAMLVLSEEDPALDLPEDQRWAAGIYGKVREHSGTLRQGICETLVLLSVHGDNLFRNRFGFDVSSQVERVIKQLLTPLTPQLLDSQTKDLPRYAEAAPKVFLELIEEDLRSSEPQVLSLMRPAATGPFSGCPRTGLLWALESLAWNSIFLPRVSLILARLAEHKIDDNWANKPESSLASIFRCRMPQTAAPLAKRIEALNLIVKKYPSVGWDLCVEQFNAGQRIGHYSYRPRWRQDSAGAGQPVTNQEASDFAHHAVELCLNWPAHDENTLSDLIEQAVNSPEEYQVRIWDLVDAWAAGSASDEARAQVREKIRRVCFTRRAKRNSIPKVSADRARRTFDLLTPRGVVARHRWLFAKHWVEESADEIHSDDFDWEKRDERIAKTRKQAIQEVWQEKGFEGIVELVADSEAPGVAGWSIAEILTDFEEAVSFLHSCLAIDGREVDLKIHNLMAGFLQQGDEERRDRILAVLLPELDHANVIRVMIGLAFNEATWRRLDQLDEAARREYWRSAYPNWHRHSPEALRVAVDNLLNAGRPRAAFFTVGFNWSDLDSARIRCLLQEVATSNKEKLGTYQLEQHSLSEALEELGSRDDVSEEEMAYLEFLYLEALDHTKHGIPNLQRQLAASPRMYVQALACVYRRKDDGDDPEDWYLQDEATRRQAASRAYSLLQRMRLVPGTAKDGSVNENELCGWVQETRRLAKEYSRGDVCDIQIGELLSAAPADEDGLWPCEPVRNVLENVLEEVNSPKIGEGLYIGVHKSRGWHYRSEGGSQEREIAAKYFDWADSLAYSFPYVSSVLRNIAQSYRREAEWEDSNASIRKRLRY